MIPFSPQAPQAGPNERMPLLGGGGLERQTERQISGMGDEEAPTLRTASSVALKLPKTYEAFYERMGKAGHFLAGLDW